MCVKAWALLIKFFRIFVRQDIKIKQCHLLQQTRLNHASVVACERTKKFTTA
jgi:hypothetical protein